MAKKLNNPKFSYGDIVSFTINHNGEDIKKVGKIYIVDKYGTFEQHEEPSYDIMVEDNTEHCLYKHIRESELISANG